MLTIDQRKRTDPRTSDRKSRSYHRRSTICPGSVDRSGIERESEQTLLVASAFVHSMALGTLSPENLVSGLRIAGRCLVERRHRRRLLAFSKLSRFSFLRSGREKANELWPTKRRESAPPLLGNRTQFSHVAHKALPSCHVLVRRVTSHESFFFWPRLVTSLSVAKKAVSSSSIIYNIVLIYNI